MNTVHFKSILFALLAAFSVSCGQTPSFVETSSTKKSGDAKPNTTGQGQEAGSEATDATGDDEGTSGDDEGTTGDDEGTSGGETSGGNTDGETDGTADGTGVGTTDGNIDAGTDGSDGSTPTIKKSKTFPAELFGDAAVSANLADPYLSQEFELKRNYTETSTTFKQVVRPGITDLFVQGNSGTPATQTFNQSASKPLDLLVMIDNSNSMQQEQVNLSQRLLPLLSYINDSDWRIGVVTTDPANGCLRRLIKKGDADAMTAFSQAVQAGTNGNGNERGVLQAVNALKCATNPWVRDQSSLAILIVSDEDNCSDGTGCGNNDYGKKEYLLDYMNQIRVTGVNAKVYGLFWHPSQNQNACSTALKPANIYAAIVADTAGIWGSICDSDYSATLSGISQNIATILDRRFTLAHVPDSGSLQVYLDDVLQTTGFTLNSNVLVFDLPPTDGSIVKAVYKYGATAIKKTFTLSNEPQDGQVNIQFNGIPVTTGFTYQAASNSVVFTDAPPEFAQVKATYTKALALAKKFDLGKKFILSTLRVYINNVETLDFTADPSVNNSVTLTNAPAEGATILFTYTAVGDAILLYPFSIDGRAAQNLTLTDAASGANIGHLYFLGVINIFGGEFSEGRKIKARYWNEGRDLTEVMLPAKPVAGSVKVTGGTKACDAGKFTVTNTLVSVKKCGFADDVKTINVGYRYTIESFMSFIFDDPDLGNAKTALSWKVWINDVETKNFTVQNTTVTLPAALPVGTGNVVKVEVSYK